MSSNPVRRLRFTYKVNLPAQPVGEKVRLWIPKPVTDEYQVVESETVEAPFPLTPTSDDAFSNQGFYMEPSASDAARMLSFSYVIERKQRRAVPVAEFATRDFDHDVTTDEKLAPYLEGNLNVPIEGFISYQARSVASPSDYPAVRARRLFDHLIETLDYDWAGCTPDRIADLGNLKQACDLRSGTCTEFHGLYVGYLRALGVPAQFAFGFNVPAGATAGPIAGYHCWSEVLLPKAGWFPVDVSEAWKQPENRDFYFGALDANRVQFHVGRDLWMSPLQDGPPIDKWIFGHAERDGEPFHLDVSFSFEDLPNSAA